MLLGFLLASQPFNECAHVIVPEATEQAMRYYNSGNILWIFQMAWSFFVPLLFLVKGFTGRLSTYAEKWTKNWYYSIVIYLFIFLALFALLNLPIDFYSEYIRQHAYGLSTQTLGRWVGNYSKQFLVTFVGAAAFVWIFYVLLKKSPRKWWIYSALVSIGITFVMMFIQPIWIDPLFNDFGPMHNKHLEKKILALASKAGIENGRVYQVDKSKDTKMLNAYVVGIGSSNRIVLWDTTIKRLTTKEILFVMGHEMGHYVLHHMWWYMIYFIGFSFILFYFLFRGSKYLMKRYQDRFGFKHVYNIASFPLFILLLNIFSFVTLPLTNFFSRTMERQADRFGLEITQNNKAAAEAFIALQKENLANPRPGLIYTFWRGTHPSLGDRIDFCNSYCPWRKGYQMKYGEYFQADQN